MQTMKWILSVFLFCSACSHEPSKPDIKFERTKWDTKKDDSYTYRKQMINDLLKNYNWPGIKKDSVIKLLGQPDEIEADTFLLYDYGHKYIGSFPTSTQSLIFDLAADSTVKRARDN